MSDTPLGNIVRIRAEKDRKVIANMSPDQKKVRADWQRFKSSKAQKSFNEKTEKERMRELERMLKAAFGRKEGNNGRKR